MKNEVFFRTLLLSSLTSPTPCLFLAVSSTSQPTQQLKDYLTLSVCVHNSCQVLQTEPFQAPNNPALQTELQELNRQAELLSNRTVKQNSCQTEPLKHFKRTSSTELLGLHSTPLQALSNTSSRTTNKRFSQNRCKHWIGQTLPNSRQGDDEKVSTVWHWRHHTLATIMHTDAERSTLRKRMRMTLTLFDIR